MKLIKKVTLFALVLACIAACLPGLQLLAKATELSYDPTISGLPTTVQAGTTTIAECWSVWGDMMLSVQKTDGTWSDEWTVSCNPSGSTMIFWPEEGTYEVYLTGIMISGCKSKVYEVQVTAPQKRTIEAGTTLSFYPGVYNDDIQIKSLDGEWVKIHRNVEMAAEQTFVWEGTYEVRNFLDNGNDAKFEIIEVVAPTDEPKDAFISMQNTAYQTGENVSFLLQINDPANTGTTSYQHDLRVYRIDPAKETEKYEVFRSITISQNTETMTFDEPGRYAAVVVRTLGGKFVSNRVIFEIKAADTTTQPTTAKPTTKPVTMKPQGNQNSCATGHTYENGSCKNCGITDPNYDPCANGHRFENGYCVVCFAPEIQATPTTKPSLPTSKPATQSVSQTTVHPVTLPADFPVPDGPGEETPAEGLPIGWLLLAIALALILVFVIFGVRKARKKKSATPVTPVVPPVVPVAGVRAGGGTDAGAAADLPNSTQE